MYPEQAVAVAGGVVAGLLLLVLLGIAAYPFWKSKYLKGSYEELTDPVTPVLQEPDVAQSTSVPPQNARYKKGPSCWPSSTLQKVSPRHQILWDLLPLPGMGNPVKSQVGHLSWVRLWGWTINPGTPRPL